MNNIKTAIGQLFGSPMQGMSFVAYMQYVNTAGKITAKSLLDVNTVLLVYMEEQEKKIALFEENFKEIEEILGKLVDKKTKEKDLFPKSDGSEWFAGLESLNDPIPTGKPVDGTNHVEVPVHISPQPPADTLLVDQESQKCEECGKEFKTKLALSGHMRSHKPK